MLPCNVTRKYPGGGGSIRAKIYYTLSGTLGTGTWLRLDFMTGRRAYPSGLLDVTVNLGQTTRGDAPRVAAMETKTRRYGIHGCLLERGCHVAFRHYRRRVYLAWVPLRAGAPLVQRPPHDREVHRLLINQATSRTTQAHEQLLSQRLARWLRVSLSFTNTHFITGFSRGQVSCVCVCVHICVLSMYYSIITYIRSCGTRWTSRTGTDVPAWTQSPGWRVARGWGEPRSATEERPLLPE